MAGRSGEQIGRLCLVWRLQDLGGVWRTFVDRAGWDGRVLSRVRRYVRGVGGNMEYLKS